MEGRLRLREFGSLSSRKDCLLSWRERKMLGEWDFALGFGWLSGKRR